MADDVSLPVHEWDKDTERLEDLRSRKIVEGELAHAKHLQKSLKVEGITDPVLEDYIENRKMQLERLDARRKAREDRAR